MSKIRVLIVEDSVFMQRLLVELLSQDPEIEVVGTASDPHVARAMIKQHEPHVLTLDVYLPRMNGFDFLERIMRLKPMPVIMFAAFTADGTYEALRALELGAFDVMAKPMSATPEQWKRLTVELADKIKAAAAAGETFFGDSKTSKHKSGRAKTRPPTMQRIVAIGASTGGVQALHHVFSALPANGPPILIAQHMPAQFTGSFAQRLDTNSAVNVREAVDGDLIEPGHAYVAPGDQHMTVEPSSHGFVCRIVERTAACNYAPSVDRLFGSLATAVGANAVGVVLSGMGRDGTVGLQQIKDAGGFTIAQDEASSLIFGMPKSAADSGAALEIADIGVIPALILKGARKKKRTYLDLAAAHLAKVEGHEKNA